MTYLIIMTDLDTRFFLQSVIIPQEVESKLSKKKKGKIEATPI
ncbi:hypothetical protein PanWU01x14_001860 [Parasponia andersonii]|uniref:Uncharacterized protein n=1 Tax=Parasponia andersonii TaxID=3476 RepID=A0A2P5E565_PARAD|nr:hypothetical protein PanWU01x14_001860 [Parasponia andersonii]